MLSQQLYLGRWTVAGAPAMPRVDVDFPSHSNSVSVGMELGGLTMEDILAGWACEVN